MATPQEKAQGVSWFIETKSDMQTQQNYRTKHGRDPPTRLSIRAWHKKFMETGTVLDKGRSGRPKTKGWPNSLATSFTRYRYPGLLSMGLC